MLRKSFQIHLRLYLVVNALLIVIWAVGGGGEFWPVWVLIGWGIGLAAHWAALSAGARRSARPSVAKRSGEKPNVPTSVDEVVTALGGERPSLRPVAAPDGTVTVLFTDIEGSTQLNERLGDVRWLELLRAHHEIVREQVHLHGGFEVKSQGDGFMIAFPSARRAVECARAIHSEIDSRLASHPDGPIMLRIGLHTGEAIRDEADFYGKNIVLAARIADEARGGEILASSVVKQLTESAGDLNFENERELQLAGLSGSHTVYNVT